MYFGLLMVQPFANMDSIVTKPAKACDKDMCCKKSPSHQKGTTPCKNSSNCNTDFCNPFVPCGISIVQRTIRPNFSNPVLDLLTKQKPALKENITSAYLADCWRPPELLS